MASVDQNVKVSYTLRLSEEEAKTLKLYMQNAMMDEEPHELRKLRAEIFHSLQEAGVD